MSDVAAPPSAETNPSPPAHKAALPFLPLLYIAWSDGDLTNEELEDLRARVANAPDLPSEAKAELAPWLDPQRPPESEALLGLLDSIRDISADLDSAQRRSLAELGLNLPGAEAAPGTLVALAEIEQALGVVPEEAARKVLGHPRQEQTPPAADVDVAALRALLDGDLADLRDRVREVLSEPLFGYEYGTSKEVQREKVLRQLKRVAEEGLGALSFPKEYGGGGDMARFFAAFETLAYGDLSLVIKFGVQFGLFGGAIKELGTERHHTKYLPAAGTVELPGGFAMTELNHGSNVADIETTAVYDPRTREFIIHTPHDGAHKEYIGNAAAHGRMAVVFAQLMVAGENHGVHALLAPIRTEAGEPAPGVRIEDCGEKEGLNGVDNGRLWFDQVRVPRENLLNRYADVSAEGVYSSPIASQSKRFFTMIGALVAGRVSIALAALSAMKSGLTIAIRYGDRRRQFGPEGADEVKILDYLTHQRRLLPPLATAYALHFGLARLQQRFLESSDDDRREVEALAAGLKAYATWANTAAQQQCRECCGGQGYMSVNRIGSIKNDTDIFCTFEGDNTVLMQLLAKSLLSEHRRTFEDMRPFTLLKYLSGRAADAVGEPNPITARATDSEHLHSATFQLHALRYRETRLVDSLARRLRHRIHEGQDSFHALIECQDHAVSAAHAAIERYLLERFLIELEGLELGPNREALDKLRSMFALSTIEAEGAWFLESGYITAAKSRAIRAQVNQLCVELRALAPRLVDAFGIPDAVLAAPIAIEQSVN